MLELWKATEEKRAALVALKQSKETLHQVWQQVRPPWVEPLIEVRSATSLQEEAPRDPEKGCGKVKRRNRRWRARAQAAASLLAGGLAWTSKSPEEPLTGEGTGRPGVQTGSLCGQGAPAGGNQETRVKQERLRPVGPIKQKEEEQPQVGVSCLLRAIKQEQPETVGHIKQEGGEQQQVEVPCWPRSVKQEEGRAGWAECQGCMMYSALSLQAGEPTCYANQRP